MGGGNTETVVGGVIVYAPTTRTFRKPRLRGDLSLLARTAHGACVHPLKADCLLVFGGYGGLPSAATPEYR